MRNFEEYFMTSTTTWHITADELITAFQDGAAHAANLFELPEVNIQESQLGYVDYTDSSKAITSAFQNGFLFALRQNHVDHPVLQSQGHALTADIFGMLITRNTDLSEEARRKCARIIANEFGTIDKNRFRAMLTNTDSMDDTGTTQPRTLTIIDDDGNKVDTVVEQKSGDYLAELLAE